MPETNIAVDLWKATGGPSIGLCPVCSQPVRKYDGWIKTGHDVYTHGTCEWERWKLEHGYN